MNTIALPSEERRVLVRSLWFSLAGLSTLAMTGLAVWLHSPIAFAAALLLGGVLGYVAVAVPAFAWRVYRAWNRRLVFPVGCLARQVVSAMCFYITIAAVGRSGSRLRRGRGRSRSAWVPRKPQPASSYKATFVTNRAVAPGTWSTEYARWATDTGNAWSVVLIPFLAVLQALPDKQQAGDAQDNIYTLF
jgi:hypothetical protein